MGVVTDEQLKQRLVQFASVDQGSGKFDISGKLYPAVNGRLLGFAVHEYDFKGKMQKKFDIFLKDDAVYQIQIGFYSWHTFKAMNSLLNIPDIDLPGTLQVSSGKAKDEINYVVGIAWNGNYIKWKYSFEELKFNGKEGSEKTAYRDKIIDKWFAYLMEKRPYVPETPPAEAEPEETNPAALTGDDDIPF